MKKTWFLTFGNREYENALQRIEKQAIDSDFFDKICIYRENDLSKKLPFFWQKHQDFIQQNSRGYGYWIWKSAIVAKTLKEMNDDDILFYADSGCEINAKGRSGINRYIQIVEDSSYGILSFELDKYFIWNYNPTEKHYTKMELFHKLQSDLHNEKICGSDILLSDTTTSATTTSAEDIFPLLDSQQLHATVFVIRKCKHAIHLVQKWKDTCEIYSMINDAPSNIPNDPGFLDHRHDQSVFSLIRKIYGSEVIRDEIQGRITCPFWGTRNNKITSLIPPAHKGIHQCDYKVAYVIMDSKDSESVMWQRNTSLNEIGSDVFPALAGSSTLYADHTHTSVIANKGIYYFDENQSNDKTLVQKYILFMKTHELQGYDWFVFINGDTFVFPRRIYSFLLCEDSEKSQVFCNTSTYDSYKSHIISKQLYKEIRELNLTLYDEINNLPTLIENLFKCIGTSIIHDNKTVWVNDFTQLFGNENKLYTNLWFEYVGMPYTCHFHWLYLNDYI